LKSRLRRCTPPPLQPLRFGAGLRSALWAGALSFLLATAAQAQEVLPSGPVTVADGRVTLGTDVSFSASSQKDQSAWFNFTDYEHSTMRLVRIAVTTDVRVTDRVSFLGEIRSENGHAIRPYALFVRVHPWKTRPIDIQAGRIPPSFGAFSRRAYANGNPLIGYPLAYQYLTSLRGDAVPASADELLRMRARGWRPSYTIGSQALETGMPLVSAFRWATGVEVRVGSERLMASTSVTNGTISDPSNSGGEQISGRVQWEPVVGLVLGGSGARGPYLANSVRTQLDLGRSSTERALGFDAEYSRDHWLVRTEGVWNRWHVPTLAAPLDAKSAFVEGSYKVLPGMFVAARADRLTFNRVTGSTQTRTWDAPITRVEIGLGYYIQRNLLGRVTSQYNSRDGGLIRKRNQFTVQLQFWL
jgi:hypothetical protein